MTVQLKTPESDLIYVFDWNEDLSNDPTGVVTLAPDTPVVHTVPIGFTNVAETTSVASGKSTVRIRGGVLGDVAVVKALATLSSGEKVSGSFTVRVGST